LPDWPPTYYVLSKIRENSVIWFKIGDRQAHTHQHTQTNTAKQTAHITYPQHGAAQ